MLRAPSTPLLHEPQRPPECVKNEMGMRTKRSAVAGRRATYEQRHGLARNSKPNFEGCRKIMGLARFDQRLECRFNARGCYALAFQGRLYCTVVRARQLDFRALPDGVCEHACRYQRRPSRQTDKLPCVCYRPAVTG